MTSPLLCSALLLSDSPLLSFCVLVCSLIAFLGEHRLLPPELRFSASGRADEARALRSILALLSGRETVQGELPRAFAPSPSAVAAVKAGCVRVLGDAALASLVERTRRRVGGGAACAVDATAGGTASTSARAGAADADAASNEPADAAKRSRLLEPAEETAGLLVEAVVQRYAAPHLKPTSILARAEAAAEAARAAEAAADASWCFSLRALLNYMDAEEIDGEARDGS